MDDGLDLLVEVADQFDASAVFGEFATTWEQLDNHTWKLRVLTHLHGLALVHATTTDEVRTVARVHPIDESGWADWSASGPGEVEMTNALLPTQVRRSRTTAYRYDDAWVWDPRARPLLNDDALNDLGLSDLVQTSRELTSGTGGWIFKAVKLSWKLAPKLADPRVQAAYWLTKQGWRIIHEQSVAQRARMERQEFDRRLMIDLAEIRRDRLERGSPSSRRKARQYYDSLDQLIAMNS